MWRETLTTDLKKVDLKGRREVMKSVDRSEKYDCGIFLTPSTSRVHNK